MKADKNDLIKLDYNGFKWSYFDEGIHVFTKKLEKGCELIGCTEEQLTNGDIQFMCEHGWTISKEERAKAKRKYLKEQAKQSN